MSAKHLPDETGPIVGGGRGPRAGVDFVSDCSIVLDGNSYATAASFRFNAARSRAVSVHSCGILEALRDVYGATALDDELVNGHR